jgi:glutaredoxin
LIKSYKIFTTPSCYKCKILKRELEAMDLKFDAEEVDASTPEGLEIIKQLNIMSVPAVVFFDEDNKEVSRATDIDEVEQCL